MDSIKLESVINERILIEQDLFKEQEQKRINSIQYKYSQIMNQLDSEITKIIESYNEILTQKFSDFKLRKYYGSIFPTSKNDNSEIQQITIIFIADKDNNIESEKDLSKHDNIVFKFKQRVNNTGTGPKTSHYFLSLYEFEIEKNAKENKRIEIKENELDKELILNELKNFFYQFIEFYLRRGTKLKPFLRIH
jgi:hypothetical protein